MKTIKILENETLENIERCYAYTLKRIEKDPGNLDLVYELSMISAYRTGANMRELTTILNETIANIKKLIENN